MAQNTVARRPNELDHSYLRYATPASPPSAGISFAVSVVKREASKFGPDDDGSFSEGHFESVGSRISETNRQHLADVLRGLMWRGRHQSNVFQIFMQLCLHGLCSLSSLGSRIEFEGNAGPLVSWIERALRCFDGLGPLFDQGSKHIPFDNPWSVDWQSFRVPERWLAVVIARSATDLHAVFQSINGAGHLGDLRHSLLDALLLDAPPQNTYPDPSACRTEFPPAAYFGLFLPHGIKLEDPANSFQNLQERFYTRLNDFEMAYDRFFNIPEEERLSGTDQKNDVVDIRDWAPAAPSS